MPATVLFSTPYTGRYLHGVLFCKALSSYTFRVIDFDYAHHGTGRSRESSVIAFKALVKKGVSRQVFAVYIVSHRRRVRYEEKGKEEKKKVIRGAHV